MTMPEVEILIAEDSLSDAELILESLAPSRARDRVHLVRDGEEALDFLFCRGPFAHRSFDAAPRLVILDIKLPKVDGLEVVRALKLDPRTQLIPVVMLTSSNLEQDVANGYRWGANSYVHKPVDFGRFREAVRLIESYWLSLNEPRRHVGPTRESHDPR